MTSKHELVEICDTLCVLTDLLLGVRIENRETSIDMPFLGIDTKGKVDLHVLDAADVTSYLPWKLGIGVPCFAHGKECSVSDSLGIRCDAVMLGGRQVDVSTTKAGKDSFDLVEAFLRSAVFDEYEGLSFGIDIGSMKRVA